MTPKEAYAELVRGKKIRKVQANWNNTSYITMVNGKIRDENGNQLLHPDIVAAFCDGTFEVFRSPPVDARTAISALLHGKKVRMISWADSAWIQFRDGRMCHECDHAHFEVLE